MKITKEQIIALDKKEVTVKELFPRIFEVSKVGKWMKDTKEHKWLMYFVSETEFYGFNTSGDWSKLKKRETTYDEYEREATNEEVSEALKNEAVKRGYKEGAYDDIDPYEYQYFNYESNILKLGNLTIFTNGSWLEKIKKIPTDIQNLINSYGKQELINILSK